MDETKKMEAVLCEAVPPGPAGLPRLFITRRALQTHLHLGQVGTEPRLPGGDSGTERVLGQGQRERGAFQVRSGGGLDGSSVQATPEWVRGTWRSRSQGDSVRERGSGPPQRPDGRTFYCGLPPKGATFQTPPLSLCLRPPKGVAESVSL